jgi:hypothetical protein
MFASIPVGQIIGGSIEACLWVAGGAYLVWMWPRHVQAQVQAGKLSEEQGRDKLKKLRPKIGYYAMALGLLRLGMYLAP